MAAREWVERVQPYADRAAQATGLPARVILAQWALETGWGTSYLATHDNNLGGIKYVGVPEQDYSSGGFAGYRSLDRFVTDYIRVLNGDWGGYPAVRAVARKAYPDAETRFRAVAQALGASAYDEGHYDDGRGPGSSLLAVLEEIKPLVPTYSMRWGAPRGGDVASGILVWVAVVAILFGVLSWFVRPVLGR